MEIMQILCVLIEHTRTPLQEHMNGIHQKSNGDPNNWLFLIIVTLMCLKS